MAITDFTRSVLIPKQKKHVEDMEALKGGIPFDSQKVYRDSLAIQKRILYELGYRAPTKVQPKQEVKKAVEAPKETKKNPKRLSAQQSQDTQRMIAEGKNDLFISNELDIVIDKISKHRAYLKKKQSGNVILTKGLNTDNND